jgi:hypothetical protein
MSSPTLPGAPDAVVTALDRLKSELVRLAGNNLASLLVYGGLARGRYRPGKSDINIVVVLREATAQGLAALAPALRAARRAAGVTPMILTPGEIPHAAKVFPITFLDIKSHHIVLHGEDPFANLEVPNEMIRLRLVQELRNRTMRLRRRIVTLIDDPELLKSTLAGVARPLAIDLTALLRLAGKTVPNEDRSAAIFQQAATTFQVDGDVLARLVELRLEGRLQGDVLEMCDKLLKCLEQLSERAEQMKESIA